MPWKSICYSLERGFCDPGKTGVSCSDKDFYRKEKRVLICMYMDLGIFQEWDQSSHRVTIGSTKEFKS